MSLRGQVFALCCVAAAACQPSTQAASTAAAARTRACPGDQQQLLQLLSSLPERALEVRGRSDLPVASLGGVIREGHVLDIRPDALTLDGAALPGATPKERALELNRRLSDAQAAPDRGGVVYVSTSGDTDARSLRTHLAGVPLRYKLFLVFQAPRDGGRNAAPPASSSLQAFLVETAPERRAGLALAAYEEHARCERVIDAVESAPASSHVERWPALRKALAEALPACTCEDLDAPELSQLLVAEQRGSASALGALPLDFMRDERCGASLELTPIQKIVQDIEAFDAQFAGSYQEGAVQFEQVVENQRLLTYLCQALPGETLASLQRARHTFFWKVRGAPACQAWQFQPLAPGSPMGTWRRRGDGPPLAVHYWQGAEEIRLYGPAPDEQSKATDERAWDCSQEFVMRGIDADSIELEKGRWFFTREACEAATERAAVPGCIAELAGAPASPPDAKAGAAAAPRPGAALP